MCQHILSLCKRCFHPPCCQPQIPFAGRKRPKRIVRIVIPLPYQRQGTFSFLPIEVIRSNNTRNESAAIGQFQLSRSTSIHTQNRPSIFPLNRNKIRNTTYRTAILKQISKPTSIRCIHQSTLCNSTILKNNTSFIRSSYLISTMHNHSTHSATWPSDIKKIILPVYLEKL